MPTHSAIVRVNLEFYRKQAKALLKAAKSGDAGAFQRLKLHSPKPAVPALHDAQLTIAREQGFPSWPRFKAFIELTALDFQGLVANFLEAAFSDLWPAQEMLDRHPELASAGLYTALVLGDSLQVERLLDEAPVDVNAKTGPQNLPLLLYVCFSRFANRKSERATALAATTEVLLRRGANPDASFTPADLPDNPLSALYGASGLNNNPAMTLALLKAGANPNDSESLYHSTEHKDLACMKLLLEYKASPKQTNVLKHMLDREEMEGLELLLKAGADPNGANERGETALHWAVWRGRSPQIVGWLLDHGADINAKRKDGRTAYAMAAQSGQKETVQLLASRGADIQLSALDRFVAERAEEEGARREALAPENSRLLPDLAASHQTEAVRRLLEAGVPVDSRGEAGGTALHWACWKGFPDLVKLLLEHGASLTIKDETFSAPPPGWFSHGSTNCGGGGDYAGVARALIAAGVRFSATDVPTGNAEADAVLREHGVIK